MANSLVGSCSARKTPLLGVCLGMQVLCNGSEEGDADGLGFIGGFCKKFDRASYPDIRIPHMGWNEVLPSNKSSLFHGLEKRNKFYFTHSTIWCCRTMRIWPPRVSMAINLSAP